MSRVLLIDDSPVFLEVAAADLEQRGWNVRRASGGKEALEAAATWRTDIVVCDLHMPEIDGLGVVRRLKEIDPSVPVIMLSGEEDLGEILRVVHQGVFDFVTKERTLDALSAAVERAAGHVAMARENARLSAELRRANADLERRVAERTVQLLQANRELETSLATLAQAQEQLVQAGKMAALGTLVAGVAHELNNPLAYTTSNIEFAIQRLSATICEAEAIAPRGSDPAMIELREITAALREARDGAFRAGYIVRDLKAFARTSDDECVPIEVEKLLESCVRLASNEIAHRARLVSRYGKVPRVLANELRLGQVFINLLLNAAQAIAPGHADKNEIQLVTAMGTSERVVITVRDTGSGMTTEILSKIFDPFFTTKPLGSGMGLGLSICHGIVTKMGGEITVESEPGKGTAFHVALPPAPAQSSHPPGRLSVIPSMIPRQVRMLIVDDELLIAASLRRGLGAEHQLQTVGSGAAALHLLASGQRFDVILCDLMMPEMTGMELYERLKEAYPDAAARMIFMTGGMLHPSAADFLAQVTSPRLQKPFDLEKLRRIVANMMRSEDAG